MLGGRVVRAVIATAVAAVVGLAAWHAGPVERIELSLVDGRFDVRGGHAADDVVVVGIDEESLQTLKHGWPYPRRWHAQVIENLRAAGARRIAYDIQFSTPSDREDDRRLAAASGPDVVFGTSDVDDNGPVILPRLLDRGAQAGVVDLPVDRDGTWRRQVSRVYDQPHFDVLAAGRGSGPAERPIDYAGSPETVTTVPFANVRSGKFNGAAVRDKVVVVGVTATVLGTQLSDVHPVATGGEMPGPEIHANAIQTILDGYPLRDASTPIGVLLILLCAAIAPAAALTGKLWPPLAAGAAGIALLLVGAQLAFNGGTIVPVAAPLLTVAIGTLGAVALTYATEVRARRRVRLAFERFVPPAVIDEVVKRDEMAPKRVHATMLFCDLRGFTTLGERLEAEQVIAALNRYLDAVSGAIFDHGGTVVSYQGDGVLAVFGAPLEQPDHARRAIAAARQILDDALPAYNRWLADSGVSERPLSAGIGVNSGPVMAGSVGSSKRLEYAAVGDTTNVAARLQALGRDHDARLFVAQTTYDQLGPDAAGLRELGPIDLKGRHEPVIVYAA